MIESDRLRGCLLGLAVGDAIGTTAEFQERGTFPAITDMVGQGPFGLKPGEWTDDTAMALCLATSLVEVGAFDADDQMKRYCQWYEYGYLSSTGHCFDIGNTVRQALHRYKETGNPFSGPTHPQSAGNGSIMRLAPVVLFYHPDHERLLHYAVESSRTTHGAQECLDACRLLAEILFRALKGANKSEVLFDPASTGIVSDSIQGIARGNYRNKLEHSIRGTGYVVNSLEAALWCFWVTDSFEATVLKAANLGDDADTTAAVCGQIAGAYYGEGSIPVGWLKQLVMREEILKLADRLSSVQPAA